MHSNGVAGTSKEVDGAIWLQAAGIVPKQAWFSATLHAHSKSTVIDSYIYAQRLKTVLLV